MISKENINYSLRNLNQRKARSFLTILSIFIGITTIFIFVSFGWGLFNFINDLQTDSSANKISIQPKGIGAPGLDDTFALTEEDLEEVEKTSGVYEATGVYFKAGEVQKKSTVKFVWLVAYDPSEPLIFEVFDSEVEFGRELRPGETGKVVLGSNYRLPDKVFPDPLELNDKFELNGEEVRVVGFLEEIGNPQDDSNIYITEEFFEELYPASYKKFGWIIAAVEVENIDLVIEKVEDSLRDSRDLEEGKEDFFVQSFQDILDSYSSSLNIVILFVIFIALISVVVSAINTANTMITSVLERVKEIGIIKSIGAKNSEVFKIFLFESGFLGFVAGLVGSLLGLLIVYGADKFLEAAGWSFLSPHYSIWLIVACVLFATITGAISGVIPAINASKTNPVDALRYE